MLTLDESITIKKHNGMPAKTMLALGALAVRKRILSGKPVVQGPHDLWSQLTFLDALDWNFYQFKHHFCVQGGYKGKQIVGARNELELNKLLKSVSFRAKKDDWSDLPEKSFTSRKLEMTAKQKKLYNEMEEEYVVSVNDETISAQMVITQYGKLQQITSGFVIDECGQWHLVEENPPKLKELMAILEQVSGKLLVSAVFKYSIAFLTAKLRDFNVAVLEGGMSPAEIKEQKRKFNEDDSCKVGLIQGASHKYGHTLLGTEKQPCYTMYFYENSYSLNDRAQLEDRIHRIGQKKNCLYIDPFCSRMDKRVIKALQKKEDISSTIVDFCKGEPS
jgi:SNF2 family DNA or RNA helicase